MGIIKTSLKYGLPAGTLYYTIREGYWSNTRQETLKVHTEQLHRAESVVKGYIHVPQSVQMTDFVGLWNSGVKKTIRAIADFNPKEAAATIQNKLQKSSSSSESSSASTPKSDKSSSSSSPAAKGTNESK